MASRRNFLRSGAFVSIALGLGAVGLTLVAPLIGGNDTRDGGRTVLKAVRLPQPRTDGPLSVEQAILRRRSRREYTGEPLTVEEVSQLLWAAQGITAPHLWTGLRSAPSAGGLYPLETYVVVKEGGVVGLEAGVYHYDPHRHELEMVAAGDYSGRLMAACVDQEWVGAAAANIVLTAVVERTRVRYGDRALQYVFQESGHAAQNVYLQAESLGLGCVVVGAFHEDEVRAIVRAPRRELPVYVIPVGRPA